MVLGSKASLSPSPKKLNESTDKKINSPGKNIRCGVLRKDLQPSLASVPQLQAGGERPSPIKLKVDSDNIAIGTVKVTATMTGPSELGSICFNMISR